MHQAFILNSATTTRHGIHTVKGYIEFQRKKKSSSLKTLVTQISRGLQVLDRTNHF